MMLALTYTGCAFLKDAEFEVLLRNCREFQRCGSCLGICIFSSGFLTFSLLPGCPLCHDVPASYQVQMNGATMG